MIYQAVASRARARSSASWSPAPVNRAGRGFAPAADRKPGVIRPRRCRSVSGVRRLRTGPARPARDTRPGLPPTFGGELAHRRSATRVRHAPRLVLPGSQRRQPETADLGGYSAHTTRAADWVRFLRSLDLPEPAGVGGLRRQPHCPSRIGRAVGHRRTVPAALRAALVRARQSRPSCGQRRPLGLGAAGRPQHRVPLDRRTTIRAPTTASCASTRKRTPATESPKRATATRGESRPRARSRDLWNVVEARPRAEECRCTRFRAVRVTRVRCRRRSL